MKVNRSSVVAGLLLLAFVGVVVAYYTLNKASEDNSSYTVIGTLTFAPIGAAYVGVTVRSIAPSLSPSPVGSFMFLIFNGQTSRGTFPTGFTAGNVVELSGKISLDTHSQTYVMNVTSITQTT
jgi:peptidoglycan/LPS O-acetylase OafA/YrhL